MSTLVGKGGRFRSLFGSGEGVEASGELGGSGSDDHTWAAHVWQAAGAQIQPRWHQHLRRPAGIQTCHFQSMRTASRMQLRYAFVALRVLQ
eukprot:363999-Chlamydomonas_euryale.AAC.10